MKHKIIMCISKTFKRYTGSKYRFVLYSFDANAVLVEPIKSRGANELFREHAKLVQHLIAKGYKPNIHYVDNVVPDIIKAYDLKNYIKCQLVLPYSHRKNAAERAIRTWKNHFITRLCSVDPHFPMHLWDRLIPQTVLTLKLLRHLGEILISKCQLHLRHH